MNNVKHWCSLYLTKYLKSLAIHPNVIIHVHRWYILLHKGSSLIDTMNLLDQINNYLDQCDIKVYPNNLDLFA